MSDSILYTSTYQWECPVCQLKVLAIRINEEQGPMGSVSCPSCGFRILVSPTIRREQPRQPVAASEIA